MPVLEMAPPVVRESMARPRARDRSRPKLKSRRRAPQWLVGTTI